MNNGCSILGHSLLVVILYWVLVASWHRIKDMIETQAVSDSGGASLDREDYPVWFWLRLTCVASAAVAIACVLIAIFLGL